jgi:hypothetical protein
MSAARSFRFWLEAHGAATRLSFRQDYASEFSDDDYGSYNYEWSFYLESLRQYCETGTGKPFQVAA